MWYLFTEVIIIFIIYSVYFTSYRWYLYSCTFIFYLYLTKNYDFIPCLMIGRHRHIADKASIEEKTPKNRLTETLEPQNLSVAIKSILSLLDSPQAVVNLH